MKKMLSLIMAVVMFLTLFTGMGMVSVAEDDIVSHLTYKVENGEVEITGCDENLSGNIVLPEKIKGYPVTSIGYHAFMQSQISYVEFPDTLKKIGHSAFWNSRVEYVSIPDSVEIIEDDAFGACSLLKGIYTGRNITAISAQMLRENSELTDVFIGQKVEKIDFWGFYLSDNIKNIYYEGTEAEWNQIVVSSNGNDVLKTANVIFNCTEDAYKICQPEIYDEDLMIAYTVVFGNVKIVGVNWDIAGDVVIPEKIMGYPVTEIDDYAMDFLPDVKSISLPKTMKYIGMPFMNQCFNIENIYVDEENEYYSSVDGNLFNKDKTELLRYAIGNVREEYTIPDTVTKIGDSAFSRISGTLKLNISESVSEIDSSAFYMAHGIYHINVSENNHYFCSEDGILFSKDKSTLVCFPARKTVGDDSLSDIDMSENNEYTIPDSVKTIAKCAFSSCCTLKSVIIPDSVEFIGAFAFEDCMALEQIELSDNITSIESGTFRCTGLRSVTIPDSVTYIGIQPFWCCENLEEINLPDSIRYLGEQVFYGTAYYKNADNWENGALYIGNYLFEISEDYTDTHIDVKENTLCIAEFAFSFAENVKSVTLPDSLKAISSSAFAGCTKLESISIPEGITEIYEYTFFACNSMNEVSIPKSVTKIDEYAFFWCDSLSCVNYSGIQQDWDAIDIVETGNEGLYSVQMRFSDGTVFGDNLNEPDTQDQTAQEPITQEPSIQESVDSTPGDLDGNGKITASDARLALRISAKLEDAAESQSIVADVDLDGKITASDARRILRVAANLESF